MADVLRERGYSTWAGVLEAERYGVPQTRERAILMASRVGVAHPPAPTHQRYVSGERARHEITFEGELLPWVSMAEALGWTGSVRTGDNSMRERGYRLARGAGMLDRHGERRAVPENEPAPVITEKAHTAEWVWRSSAMSNAAERSATEPAPTITAGHDSGERVWLRAGTNANDVQRAEDQPAPTLRYGSRMNDVSWVSERPATAVRGDGPTRSGDNAIRVTVQEAAILQSFPPDFPWQGSRTARFRQIGNAVPPLLARAIFGALLASRGTVGAESDRTPSRGHSATSPPSQASNKETER